MFEKIPLRVGSNSNLCGEGEFAWRCRSVFEGTWSVFGGFWSGYLQCIERVPIVC